MMWLPYLIRNWCRGGCNTASPALLPVSVMAGAKLEIFDLAFNQLIKRRFKFGPQLDRY
jgi:hypothetical protein